LSRLGGIYERSRVLLKYNSEQCLRQIPRSRDEDVLFQNTRILIYCFSMKVTSKMIFPHWILLAKPLLSLLGGIYERSRVLLKYGFEQCLREFLTASHEGHFGGHYG